MATKHLNYNEIYEKLQAFVSSDKLGLKVQIIEDVLKLLKLGWSNILNMHMVSHNT